MSSDSRGLSDHLNREFSPSVWSKRFPTGDLVIHHHLNHIETESSKAIQDVKCELDVQYGFGDREKYDIFGIDLPNDSPIVIFVHGGYWHELSREQSRYIVKPLHDIGIKTIVLGYDLCPTITLKQIVEQVKNAILKIFKYASEKKSRAIYIIGHSAGGHLVAKFLSNKITLECIPNLNVLQGVFLISGVYDLTELIKTHENQYLKLSLEDAKSLSPQMDNYYHMRSLSLRLYILVAEYDSYTFKKQSRNFYDMLMESCQVQNIHFEIKNKCDHFDIMEVLSEPDNYLNVLLLEDLIKIQTE